MRSRIFLGQNSIPNNFYLELSWMQCVFLAVFIPKVKYRHYYTADISNSTDASARIVSKEHNIFWFYKIYIGYIGS